MSQTQLLKTQPDKIIRKTDLTAVASEIRSEIIVIALVEGADRSLIDYRHLGCYSAALISTATVS